MGSSQEHYNTEGVALNILHIGSGNIVYPLSVIHGIAKNLACGWFDWERNFHRDNFDPNLGVRVEQVDVEIIPNIAWLYILLSNEIELVATLYYVV